MLGRMIFSKKLAAIVCILGIVFVALAYVFPSPPTKVTIATAFKGSSFEYYGKKYKEILARSGVTAELRETAGAVENLKLLQDPKSGVDIGLFEVRGGIDDHAEPV